MSNNKQTAVEWLYETIDNELIDFLESRIDVNELSVRMLNAKQQAKEMEKQQIVEAYRLGHIFHDTNDSNSAQEYYDTEYGKQ